MLRDAIALLGLPPDEPATPEQTKRAYLRKLREHPPEKDPDGFKHVRAAYDLVKHGYAPALAADATWTDDDEQELPREHAALHAEAPSFDEDDDDDHDDHDDEVEDDPGAIEHGHRARVVVDEALRHLETGDVAAARAVVAATPVEIHDGWIDRELLQRYVGLRELIERAHKLPATAVPYFGRALRELKVGEPAGALFAFRRKHRRDATHAFQVIRGSEAVVLRSMVVLVEPPFTLPTWVTVAVILLILMIRVLTWMDK